MAAEIHSIMNRLSLTETLDWLLLHGYSAIWNNGLIVVNQNGLFDVIGMLLSHKEQ